MKKIRIFCDMPLVLGSVLVLIANSVLCIWMMIIAPDYTSSSDVYAVRCIWGIVLLLFYLGFAMASKRIFSFVAFDSAGISFWAPLMHVQTNEYKRYTHIYPASYFHGNILGLGCKIPYVVFSQKYLSDEALTNINQLVNSPEVFKIRIRGRKFEEVLKRLPPYQAEMLQSAVKIKNSKV